MSTLEENWQDIKYLPLFQQEEKDLVFPLIGIIREI